MAETPKGGKKKVAAKKKAPAAPEFVTVDEFKKLETGVGELLEMLKQDREDRAAATPGAPLVPAATPVPPGAATPVAETPVDKEIRKAGADPVQQVPVDWDEKAREIIGDPLDHCEMTYGQNGGVRFIVVIKKEFSNAKKDYLAYYGQDRRTKDIAGEGIAGVEAWCKLIKQNLARPN